MINLFLICLVTLNSNTLDQGITDCKTAYMCKLEAETLKYHGKFDQAIEKYNKAIEMNENDVELYIGRGDAYYQKAQAFLQNLRTYNYLMCINLKNNALFSYDLAICKNNSCKLDNRISDALKEKRKEIAKELVCPTNN